MNNFQLLRLIFNITCTITCQNNECQYFIYEKQATAICMVSCQVFNTSCSDVAQHRKNNCFP